MTTTTVTTDFAIRTTDTAWIKRHHGHADAAGRIIVQVPVAEITPVKMAGKNWLRHTFADCPQDIANPVVMCPAVFVPQSAAQFTFATEDMRGDFLRRAARA